MTEVFDDFNLDQENDENAMFKLILARTKENTLSESDMQINQPPISLMLELKGKLQERKATIIDKEPVTYKVFDREKGRFIDANIDERAQRQASHKIELANIKRKEADEKAQMEIIMKENRQMMMGDGGGESLFAELKTKQKDK